MAPPELELERKRKDERKRQDWPQLEKVRKELQRWKWQDWPPQRQRKWKNDPLWKRNER